MVAWMHGNSAWRHHFGFAKVALYAWAHSKTLRQKLKFNLVHQFCENRVKILDSSMQTKCLVKFFSWSKIPLMPCEDSVMKKGNWDYHVTLNFAEICSLSYNFLLWKYLVPRQKLVPVRQLHQLVSKASSLNYNLCLSTLFYISLTWNLSESGLIVIVFLISKKNVADSLYSHKADNKTHNSEHSFLNRSDW